MKIYLVGGAVRDKLLSLPVTEKDWLVVGAKPEELLNLGYQPVGKQFPVFLHPETKEEYALARTEVKTAPGYQGFEFKSSPSVTLEEDLLRRDLTINAIAEDSEGNIIDPYQGQRDLQDKVLRHVSQAFIEDPVRVLRIARFAARFSPLGFTIAPETIELIRDMVANKETDALVAERIWQEFNKALQAAEPVSFVETLAKTGADLSIFGQDFDSSAASRALSIAAHKSEQAEVRFAATVHHLGDNVGQFCQQLRVPNSFKEVAELCQKHVETYKNITELPPSYALDLLKSCDAFRKPERFIQFLSAAEIICAAEPGKEDWPQPQHEYLSTALNQAKAITAKHMTKSKLSGKELADELDEHRKAAIFKIKRTYRWAKF